jgi:hypothetical protein
MQLRSLIPLVGLLGLSCAQAQTHGEERREARRGGDQVNQAVAQACKSELQQLCEGQKGQQAEQCLRNNQAKLSSQCKGAVTTSGTGASKPPQN